MLTQGIQAMRKEISRVFDPIVERAMEAKRAAEATRKEAVDQKTKAEAPLVEAEGILYPKIDAYVQAERKKAAEEEARIREAARKAEEEARLAAAVAAEEARGDGNRGNHPRPLRRFPSPGSSPPRRPASASGRIGRPRWSISWSSSRRWPEGSSPIVS